MNCKMTAAIFLCLLATPAALTSPTPPPWGRTPFFGDATAYEASDSVLQRQLEQYGSDLSDAVNKLRDMANVARSPALHSVLLGKIDRVVACWQENLQVLESVLLRTFPRAPAVADFQCSQQRDPNTESSSTARDATNGTDDSELYTKTSYDDVYQIFHHITRDWSDAGAAVRREIYQPIVRLVAHEQASQIRSHGKGRQQLLRVLVPGSGLGRLAYDLAHAGLSVTGMEVSTLMLSVAFALFNSRSVPTGSPLPQQLRLYPYIHDEYTNEMSGQDRFGAVFVPDVEMVQTTTMGDTQNTTEKLTPLRHPHLHLSFVQADFVASFSRFNSRSTVAERKHGTASRYMDDQGRDDKLKFEAASATCSQHHRVLYDVVVTCFLIDAVSHVEDAIAAVYGALRPGGLWLNVGPLQWHEHSVMHLALDELLQVVKAAGFELKDVNPLGPVAYRSARDGAGTRPMLYRPVLWAARRL